LAKRRGKPYKVNHLTFRDFVDFKMLKDKLVPNVRIAADGTTRNWKQLKCLMFKKETPNVMFFRNEYWEDYKAIDTAMQRS
jgi:hypothetical protein